jgi:hypothetical protein
MNPISNEPVAVQVVAAALAWLAARYGLDMSEADAFKIAGFVIVGLVPFVRQLVRPTAKDQPPVAPTVYVPPRADRGGGVSTGSAPPPVSSAQVGPPADYDG